MNCTFHIQNPIIAICIAPHKCQYQRKLCTKCLYDHGVDSKQAVPTEIFQDKALNKLKEFKLNQTNEITKQRRIFKSMLSQTETMLNKIFEELSEQIKQIYDWIEQENQQYLDLINEKENLAESSYTHIEKLVSIVEGTKLIDWNDEKSSYMMKVEKIKNWWDKEIQAFINNSNEELKMIQQFVNSQMVWMRIKNLFKCTILILYQLMVQLIRSIVIIFIFDLFFETVVNIYQNAKKRLLIQTKRGELTIYNIIFKS